MRKEYDFSKMKGEKNPYVKDLKTQITIRLDKETIEYFLLIRRINPDSEILDT